MYSLILALSPLLQCAKEAGKSVMGFISSTILTLVKGGREAFNSMGKVQSLYRLDKIKQKTSTDLCRGSGMFWRWGGQWFSVWSPMGTTPMMKSRLRLTLFYK